MPPPSVTANVACLGDVLREGGPRDSSMLVSIRPHGKPFCFSEDQGRGGGEEEDRDGDDEVREPFVLTRLPQSIAGPALRPVQQASSGSDHAAGATEEDEAERGGDREGPGQAAAAAARPGEDASLPSEARPQGEREEKEEEKREEKEEEKREEREAAGEAGGGGRGRGEEAEVAEEALIPKKARDPSQPTRAEWEAHQANHLPYRSWCKFCVEGRLDNPPHRRRAGDAEQPSLPEVHLDYAFVKRDGEERTTTILVAKHRQSRAVRCWVVPRKGRSEAVAAELAFEGIRGFGIGEGQRIVVKCDNEESILALRYRVLAMWPGGSLEQEPTVYEHE